MAAVLQCGCSGATAPRLRCAELPFAVACPPACPLRSDQPHDTRLGSPPEQFKVLRDQPWSGSGGDQPRGAAQPPPPGSPKQGMVWPYQAPPAARRWAAAARRSARRSAARGWRPYVPWGKLSVLLLLLAGVVASDVAKSRAVCPSRAYWLSATAMAPLTLLALLAVRCGRPCVAVFLLCCTVVCRQPGRWHPLAGATQPTPASAPCLPPLTGPTCCARGGRRGRRGMRR